MFWKFTESMKHIKTMKKHTSSCQCWISTHIKKKFRILIKFLNIIETKVYKLLS